MLMLHTMQKSRCGIDLLCPVCIFSSGSHSFSGHSAENVDVVFNCSGEYADCPMAHIHLSASSAKKRFRNQFFTPQPVFSVGNMLVLHTYIHTYSAKKWMTNLFLLHCKPMFVSLYSRSVYSAEKSMSTFILYWMYVRIHSLLIFKTK